MRRKKERIRESKGIKMSKRKSEEEKNYRLTEYFHNLLKRRINFRVTRDEIKDIISSVDFLVETLVAKITSKVAWLPFSRVVRVGSMAEGTSVGQPNEFDYLAVLKIEQSGIEVERTCENRRGYAHVKITDPYLRTIWGKWMDGEYLKSDFTRGDSDMLSNYFDTLGNAFQLEVSNVLQDYDERLVCKTNIGEMKSETIFICDVKKHGPAFTPKFVWKSKRSGEKITMGVDITPAIEIDISTDIISAKDTFDPRFFSKVEEHGKCLLISCRNNASCEARQCFCLAFTLSEVELVRGLSQHHKDCYKLLKYIFNSRHGYTFFPSYAWKTLVLKHSCHCDETENLAVCFKQLVAACLHYMFNRKTEEKIEFSRIARVFMPGEKFVLNIPSVFFKQHNILDSKDYKFPCEQFLQEIEIMLRSLEGISCRETTEVDDRSLKIVNSRVTGAEAYVSTLPLPKFLPFVKSNTDLTQCLEDIL
ncbi:uncharacterized protein LOC128548913 [Mercenaria mercenaria]|uniref:uncharacterized protein LOC128548913 n=1 Tax=Mercenaria mercenaria TaxID=6596 RepID=UPI00234E624F|nr:uncharacterized protein LOC128548913 [Mercenaria mercenaria]